ncbi:MAG: hypothetical protein WD066_15485 [Planctomycetaceae bacterium]
MAATIEDPPVFEPPAVPRPELPDASSLQDRMPHWLRWPRSVAGATFVIGVIFLLTSHRPLWHTDVWGHLSYGRWIVEHGALPQTEPFMPLAEGVRFVDTAWLSQVLGYLGYRAFGPSALQFLYAAGVALAAGCLMWAVRRRTGSVIWGTVAVLAFLVVDWQQLVVARPQIGALACFTALFAIVVAKRPSRADWFVVPALFAVWANLHGSFPVGLGLLAACCAGRAFDVFRRTRRPGAMLHDRKARRLFVLLELAAVAALVNPYGLGLYVEVFAFSNSPNLASLLDWEPLTLRMHQGRIAAAMALALVFLYRMTPRRIAAAEVLLLVGLGAAALWASRFLAWWAPVAAYYATIHAAACWRHARSVAAARDADLSNDDELPDEAASSPRTGKWAVVTLGLAWICFGYSSFGLTVLHGDTLPLAMRVGARTPLAAVDYLLANRDDIPAGMVFNTYEWGDYLLWAGNGEIPVFVASHAHLLPTEIWQQYLAVSNRGAAWEEILARHGVDSVLIDRHRQAALAASLEEHEDWRLSYSDGVASLFVRREPIKTILIE